LEFTIMTHVDDKKHRPSLTEGVFAAAKPLPEHVADAIRRGYNETAATLFRHKGRERPKNPFPLPVAASQREQVEQFGAWQEGSDRAVRDYHAFDTLSAEQKAAMTDAVNKWELDHPSDSVTPTGGQTAREQGWARVTNPHLKGTYEWGAWNKDWDVTDSRLSPPTEEPAAAEQEVGPLEAVRATEAEVLALLSALHLDIQNLLGDLAKDFAAYQASGYQRLSVEEQTKRQAAFRAREKSLTGAARWLAIGKTDIEKGFMCVVRSLYPVE
jgi:hypothetical protein